MSPKINLASSFLIMALGLSTIAKAQDSAKARDSAYNNYHIFYPSTGRDILRTYMDGHDYKIVSLYNKTTDLYIDNRKIAENEWPKFDAIIGKIKATVKKDEIDEARDMEQAQRDREQAERDRVQAERDREQSERDREQARRDREQGEMDQQQGERDRGQGARDREQAQQDRQQAERDREQAERDRQQGPRDREQGDNDREQGERDREQAAEDRAMMKQMIQCLVDKNIIPDAKSLKSLEYTDTALVVNGIKQPEKTHAEIKNKFGKWALSGLSYGCCQDSGTTIFFSTRSVD